MPIYTKSALGAANLFVETHEKTNDKSLKKNIGFMHAYIGEMVARRAVRL
jgi:hypothetical protein